MDKYGYSIPWETKYTHQEHKGFCQTACELERK